jgi:hypothetical protein
MNRPIDPLLAALAEYKVVHADGIPEEKDILGLNDGNR